MCTSIVHVIFNILLIGATLMLIVGTFAPGWATQVENKVTGGKIVVKKGLISWDCVSDAAKETNLNVKECEEFDVSTCQRSKLKIIASIMQ